MPTGPDLSHYQGNGDFRAVRAAGHDFVILKATEDTSYGYASWFKENAPRVKSAGLVLGAYHFLRTGDGAAEARYFVSTVDAVDGFGGVIAVLDVETAADGSQPMIQHVQAFANEFGRLVPGHPLVIYTGRWYWVGHMGNPHGSYLGPLWHSEYVTTQAGLADGPEGDRYGGWDGCTLWQWTSSGSCPGISGHCDLNILRKEPLAALTGDAAPTPPTQVQEEDDMLTVISALTPDGQPDNSRQWAALGDGYTIRFSAVPFQPYDPRDVWRPADEYVSGVAAGYYKPVKALPTADFDRACETARSNARPQ